MNRRIDPKAALEWSESDICNLRLDLRSMSIPLSEWRLDSANRIQRASKGKKMERAKSHSIIRLDELRSRMKRSNLRTGFAVWARRHVTIRTLLSVKVSAVRRRRYRQFTLQPLIVAIFSLTWCTYAKLSSHPTTYRRPIEMLAALCQQSQDAIKRARKQRWHAQPLLP